MIFSFLYVFITSLSIVLVQKLDTSIPPLFSLLITSTIAVIFFNLINLRDLKNVYLTCWQHKKRWLAVMLTILVMWSCSMIAPGKIGASLYGFLYFSCLGVIGFLSLSFQNWYKNKLKFYCALCLMALIVINIALELNHAFSIKILLGVFFSMLGGACSFVYFKQSQAIIKVMHLSATQILAVRFYLTILVLSVFLPRSDFHNYFNTGNINYLVLLAFLSLIAPLYFSQKALEKVSSELHAIILSLSPIVLGIMQEAAFGDVTLQQGVIYLLYSITLTGFSIVEKYKKIEVVA